MYVHLVFSLSYGLMIPIMMLTARIRLAWNESLVSSNFFFQLTHSLSHSRSHSLTLSLSLSLTHSLTLALSYFQNVTKEQEPGSMTFSSTLPLVFRLSFPMLSNFAFQSIVHLFDEPYVMVNWIGLKK